MKYELPAATVIEASFIGRKGTRLEAPGLDDLNQVRVSNLALGDALLDPLSAHPGLAPIPYAGFNGTVAQALRPFPQYQGINQGQWAIFGSSLYNSLQIQATRHFSKGLAVLVAYTWSKAIGLVDNAGPDGGQASQDVYNRGLERSVESFNVPQYLKVSWIYELPIGPGKKLNITGLAGNLAVGWSVTGTLNYHPANALH